jgi:hypothetical protein
MFETTFSSGTRFPVFIEENLELGIISHLSYKLNLGQMYKNISGPEKFVSGGFRFTDLNTDLIYKLCKTNRFSTLLVDGERVFNEDTKGLQNILLKILIPMETIEDVLAPVESSGILSAPISILGVQLVNTPLNYIEIGKYYNYKAKSVLYIGQHKDKRIQLLIS